jgi:hypothetical protein
MPSTFVSRKAYPPIVPDVMVGDIDDVGAGVGLIVGSGVSWTGASVVAVVVGAIVDSIPTVGDDVVGRIVGRLVGRLVGPYVPSVIPGASILQVTTSTPSCPMPYILTPYSVSTRVLFAILSDTAFVVIVIVVDVVAPSSSSSSVSPFMNSEAWSDPSSAAYVP